MNDDGLRFADSRHGEIEGGLQFLFGCFDQSERSKGTPACTTRVLRQSS